LQTRLARLGPDVKWVDPASMHVTLLFLGEVDPRELVEVCRVVQRVAAEQPAFTTEVVGVGCFPNVRRPRVLYAAIAEGADELRQLHATLEAPLVELGCYRREDREFTPHVTLGRVQGGVDAEVFGQELPALERWQGGATPVEEVLVMSSEMRAEGPEYTVVGRADLAD
jgi:2'-5' RNA ligase